MVIIFFLVSLSGCTSKYIPHIQDYKKTAQIQLPKQTRVELFTKTTYIQLLTTDDKGCTKDYFILPLTTKKSTITIVANKLIIFSITHPSYYTTCYVNMDTILSPDKLYKLNTKYCYGEIKGAKLYKTKMEHNKHWYSC